jgi:hypothetical protein
MRNRAITHPLADWQPAPSGARTCDKEKNSAFLLASETEFLRFRSACQTSGRFRPSCTSGIIEIVALSFWIS